MVELETPLQARLDKVLRQFGSVAELARLIGVSDNAIYKWLSGRGQPSVANLVALARASKVSLEWLATGEEAPSRTTARRKPEHEDFVYAPRSEDAPLGTLRSEQIVDHLAFKKTWVRAQLNTDPRNLLLIEAVGDSMAPTLVDRDLILVDLGEPRFRHDGVYVLRRDNILEVKRLQRRPDGALNLISDNPAYAAAVVAGETIHVLGRAIWTGRRL